MESARNQAPPCREYCEDVMCDKLRPFVPLDAINKIFYLETNKKNKDSGTLGMVLKQAAVVGPGHAAPPPWCDRAPKIPEDVARLQPHVAHDEAAQGVDADVSRQNIAAGLVLEDRMKRLDGDEDPPQGDLDRDEDTE